MLAKSWKLLVVGLTGATLTLWLFPAFSIIAFDDVSPADVGQVFLGLIFVALVIERATEVYVNVQLEPDKQAALQPVVNSKAQVHRARAELQAERKSPSPSHATIQARENRLETAINDLGQQTQAVVPQLQEHANQARTQTSVLAMSLGVLAGLVGIRALAPFLDDGQLVNCVAGAMDADARDAIETALKGNLSGDQLQTAQSMASEAFKTPCNVEDWQRRLFAGVDVILTGALLAGGADGLHQIVKKVTEFGKADEDPVG
jgi:hypothetical protein